VSHSSAFLESIIAFLLPYVITAAKDACDARKEIISDFDSYLLKMGLKAALCRWKTRI
jgi:hypothetical protein